MKITKPGRFRLIIKLAFILYCALMIWLLFGQRWGKQPQGEYYRLLIDNLYYRPFETTINFVMTVLNGSGSSSALVRHAVINLAGNVVMFIPLGFFLPCLFPKLRTAKRLLLYVAAIIFAIETVQLFTLLGIFDVDDLILNIFGAMIGYMFFRKCAV